MRQTSARPESPLHDAKVMAFAVTRDAAVCREFYEGKLGPRVISEDPMAIVMESGGTTIRFQKMPQHQPAQYTVFGWQVTDIRATVGKLLAAEVAVERFAWMTMQDDAGVATFSNGDMVAWFKDAEGNVLSIVQLVR